MLILSKSHQLVIDLNHCCKVLTLTYGTKELKMTRPNLCFFCSCCPLYWCELHMLFV